MCGPATCSRLCLRGLSEAFFKEGHRRRRHTSCQAAKQPCFHAEGLGPLVLACASHVLFALLCEEAYTLSKEGERDRYGNGHNCGALGSVH